MSSDSIIDNLDSSEKSLDCCEYDKDSKFEVIAKIKCPSNDCQLNSGKSGTVEVNIWNKKDNPRYIFLSLSAGSAAELQTTDKDCKHIGSGDTRCFSFSVEYDADNPPTTATIDLDFSYVLRKKNCKKDHKKRSGNYDIAPKIELI